MLRLLFVSSFVVVLKPSHERRKMLYFWHGTNEGRPNDVIHSNSYVCCEVPAFKCHIH